MGCGCKKKRLAKPSPNKVKEPTSKPSKNLTQEQQESLVNEIINKINKLPK